MTLLIPEFNQSQSYSAKRWRRAVERYGNVQPGVLTDGFVLTKDASGWGFTVSGGRAFVPANAAGATANAGLYHVEADATPLTGLVTPAHATLPRIDRLVIRVNDSADSTGFVGDNAEIVVNPGTPTAGASLTNYVGPGSVGTNTLHLADILVPGGAASIAAATVRDRRPWARGVIAPMSVTSGDINTPAISTITEIGRVKVNFGRLSTAIPNNLVQFGMTGSFTNTSAAVQNQVWFEYSQNDTGTWTVVNLKSFRPWRAFGDSQFTYVEHAAMAPGYYAIRCICITTTGTMTMRANSTVPFRWWVRELPRGASISDNSTP